LTITINLVDKATGTINVPLHIQAAISSTNPIKGIQWLCDKQVNYTVDLNNTQLNFTPSINGEYTFTVTVTDTVESVSKSIKVTVGTVTPPPTPVCPAGQHWDVSQNKCVPDVQPPPNPPPVTGTLWDSNVNGQWNNGVKRTLTTAEGGQKPDDKSIFCAASGNPKLIIDGDGVAHLQAGSGGVDNLSVRLRSRHQGECNNVSLSPAQRFGGHGWAIDKAGAVDFKTEDYHNVHSNAHSFNSGITVGETWHHLHQTCKGNETTLTVDNKLIGKVTVQNHGDDSLLPKNSYIWLRLNNSAHGRIYIMAINIDSALDLDFRFEQASSSIGFANVKLVSI